ncbi:head-tail connector protein [Catenuloplanes atrovinosus]|uniref:PhiE125 gp8 family phage protein n=1 Tax=Catenuloplanes atrovinosus TaxID=137266 RepID=A0AAE3YVS7_9ACTN|nr:head-tail connector protein [Catenuloplanes atrovinosus]MDR7278931.1 putative phiE125 gp8 family phage protein [Catenuloplanes atrovinosus]
MAAVTLDAVKRHLNITGDAADAELPTFIATAQAMVEELVGPISPVEIVGERHTSGTCQVWLHRTPVLTVVSVAERTGGTSTPLDPAAYFLDPDDGSLTREGYAGARFGGSLLLVTYEAGRDPVPPGLQWAIMELTAHLWRSTQAQRGGRARTDTLDATTGAAFGMPNRVRDALTPWLLPAAVA